MVLLKKIILRTNARHRKHGQFVRHARLVVVGVLGYLYIAHCSCTKSSLPKLTVGLYQLQVAATPQSRGKGLQGVRHIPRCTGMLFIYPTPTRAVYWMYKCYTPMDIVFLDINGNVQGVVPAMPPTTQETAPEQVVRYTTSGPMKTNLVQNAALHQTAYVVEVPLCEGAHFAQTSAHLVPRAVMTAGIIAN